MFVQPQFQLRLSVEQIVAAILLLSSDERNSLEQFIPSLLGQQSENGYSTLYSEGSQISMEEDNGADLTSPKVNEPSPIETVHNRTSQNSSYRDGSWSEFVNNIDEFAVDIGIDDLAVNHDHYLYGLPKREAA